MRRRQCGGRGEEEMQSPHKSNPNLNQITFVVVMEDNPSPPRQLRALFPPPPKRLLLRRLSQPQHRPPRISLPRPPPPIRHFRRSRLQTHSTNPKHNNNNSTISSVYIDIVCSLNGNPVWILVSDRNPRYNYFKELRPRILQVLMAARHSNLTVMPSSVILFFSNGLRDDVIEKLRDEFGAIDFAGFGDYPQFEHEFDEEGDWVYVDYVLPCRSFERACFLEIKIEAFQFHPSIEFLDFKRELKCGNNVEHLEMDNNVGVDLLGESFCCLVSKMKSWCDGDVVEDNAELVNFDTTALVAAVSGISNGVTGKLLDTPESDLRARFKGNYEFVINQVSSEITHPIHADMAEVISGKRGIICNSVFSEFQELVSMCGGSREKLRAQHFLKQLKVVPDCPSDRMMSLPTTRKLAWKNKLVFGTGDHYHAPTITANMAFVRAVSQTGMSLFTVEHRPRALVGD